MGANAAEEIVPAFDYDYGNGAVRSSVESVCHAEPSEPSIPLPLTLGAVAKLLNDDDLRNVCLRVDPTHTSSPSTTLSNINCHEQTIGIIAYMSIMPLDFARMPEMAW